MQLNVCIPSCNTWGAEFAVVESVTPAKVGVQVGSPKKTGYRQSPV